VARRLSNVSIRKRNVSARDFARIIRIIIIISILVNECKKWKIMGESFSLSLSLYSSFVYGGLYNAQWLVSSYSISLLCTITLLELWQ